MQLPARPEILQGSRAKQSPYCFKRLIDPTPPKNECTKIRKTRYKRNAHGAATQTLRRPRHKPVQGSEVALTNRQTYVLPAAGVLKSPTRPEIQVGASTRKVICCFTQEIDPTARRGICINSRERHHVSNSHTPSTQVVRNPRASSKQKLS
jgi:hypothetical protein